MSSGLEEKPQKIADFQGRTVTRGYLKWFKRTGAYPKSQQQQHPECCFHKSSLGGKIGMLSRSVGVFLHGGFHKCGYPKKGRFISMGKSH